MTNLIAFYFLTQIQNYLTINSSPWTDDQCEEHPFRHSTKLFLNCAVVSLVCGAKKEYYSLNQYGTCGCCLSSTSSQSLCPVCVWGVKIRTILVGFSGNFFRGPHAGAKRRPPFLQSSLSAFTASLRSIHNQIHLPRPCHVPCASTGRYAIPVGLPGRPQS